MGVLHGKLQDLLLFILIFCVATLYTNNQAHIRVLEDQISAVERRLAEAKAAAAVQRSLPAASVMMDAVDDGEGKTASVAKPPRTLLRKTRMKAAAVPPTAAIAEGGGGGKKSKCTKERKPYHTILTSGPGAYQQWQPVEVLRKHLIANSYGLDSNCRVVLRGSMTGRASSTTTGRSRPRATRATR